jgi:hypothetical protein
MIICLDIVLYNCLIVGDKMKIEIATLAEDANKVKGDLLEDLATELLEAYNYKVIKEIKFTGMELDLLCTHRINQKDIYVECKALSDNVGAPIIRQLWGTVDMMDYAEGWLISTSEFGKEAKGITDDWKKKPPAQATRMSFYGPEEIIESLQRTNIICSPPVSLAIDKLESESHLGDWTLLVSPFGKYWCVYVKKGGVPAFILVFDAKTASHIDDSSTLENIAKLNSTLTKYEVFQSSKIEKLNINLNHLPSVAEVQTGDSWEDYRPARPSDFIGRDTTQSDILNFIDRIANKQTQTRIFAITGNSGLGKSSLIAKIRERSQNKYYKNRIYTFAVDVRAARSPSYISASLLGGLKKAQECGFGSKVELEITNPQYPLQSPPIENYLNSLEESNQVVCVIFDQFEELYSNSDLASIYDAASELMLDTASRKGNLVLGFAWKTDSTTSIDSKAYHFWQKLSDYRIEYELDVFDSGEIAKSLTRFEKEVDYKIPKDLRSQISNSCQGFPWLLKKLCINLHNNIKKGDGSEVLQQELDIKKLFEGDLSKLTKPERTCLDLIAEKAPVSWNEIVDITGSTTLSNLINNRLVTKSGDHLNIYWDIFKDYLLTREVPVVSISYIPKYEIAQLLKIANDLKFNNYIDSYTISKNSKLSERTVLNIGTDLVMFGLAERNSNEFRSTINHENEVSRYDWNLDKLREKFSKHQLKLALYKRYEGKEISLDDITSELKVILSNKKFENKTWLLYSRRLVKYLVSTGFLSSKGKDYRVKDLGSPPSGTLETGRKGKTNGRVFNASAPPAIVCEALNRICDGTELNKLLDDGYRNSITVLKRLGVIRLDSLNNIVVNTELLDKYSDFEEAILMLAKKEPFIDELLSLFNPNLTISGYDLGCLINKKYSLNWSNGSIMRNGNAIKSWVNWIFEKDELISSQIS